LFCVRPQASALAKSEFRILIHVKGINHYDFTNAA
jgi:hypothetical protein